MEKDSILQNLKDAGCDKEVIDKFFKLTDSNQTDTALKLLTKHKSQLLDNLHKSQKQIDCLDFLIFNIKQENQKL